MIILGISAFYHDSAACLIVDGKIISAAQEERFTRIKHDKSFPEHAIKYCLKEYGVQINQVDKITFYEDPEIKFLRILDTYKRFFPYTIRLFFRTFLVWFFKKRFWIKILQKCFKESFNYDLPKDKLFNVEHHLSHAASAFIPSPFDNAAILIMDGVGEFASSSIWKGEKNKIDLVEKINFPDSIGLLYSSFTYYCGFKVNSGEYKLMGLAPYGEPKYYRLIRENLIKISTNGRYKLDMNYFSFHIGDYMTNSRFHELFGGEPRQPESKITQKEMDIAASIQKVVEEVILKYSKHAISVCNSKNLCLAGGVALNCVANGKLISEGITENLWIQPASGDAGGSLGSALYYYNIELGKKLNKENIMEGAYLGPSFTNTEVTKKLKVLNGIYERYKYEDLYSLIAKKISKGNVIGWFQGRMEFGPRALGNRSIIGDPRNIKMQKTLNLKIKYRESFRPFAPSVLIESCSEFFNLSVESPYMLLVSDVREKILTSKKEDQLFGIEKLKIKRSLIPAVTHVDYSARIQTVDKKTNPTYHNLISEFKKLTGIPVLVNTSFNVRGEPIVCSVEDAFNCFINTGMDILVINNIVLFKNDQIVKADLNNFIYELD